MRIGVTGERQFQIREILVWTGVAGRIREARPKEIFLSRARVAQG